MLVEIAQVLTPVIAIVALVMAGMAIKSGRELSRREARRRQAETTMIATRSWLVSVKPAMAQIHNYMNVNSGSFHDALVKNAFDSGFRHIIRPLLEEMEHLALGVRMKVYSAEVVRNIACSVILDQHNKFEPYLNAIRSGNGAIAPQKAAYEHWDWLCKYVLTPVKLPLVLEGTLTDTE